MTKHHKHRLQVRIAITVAVGVATVAAIVTHVYAPHLEPYSPLAGLFANLLWIWRA